jgi:hypothetical protein
MSTNRLSAALSGFTSKRIRPINRPAGERPAAPFGGWGPPSHDGVPILDPEQDARAQRTSGAEALAQHERERAAEKQAVMDARLGAAPRGYDFSHGIFARFGRES